MHLILHVRTIVVSLNMAIATKPNCEINARELEQWAWAIQELRYCIRLKIIYIKGLETAILSILAASHFQLPHSACSHTHICCKKSNITQYSLPLIASLDVQETIQFTCALCVRLSSLGCVFSSSSSTLNYFYFRAYTNALFCAESCLYTKLSAHRIHNMKQTLF